MVILLKSTLRIWENSRKRNDKSPTIDVEYGGFGVTFMAQNSIKLILLVTVETIMVLVLVFIGFFM